MTIPAQARSRSSPHYGSPPCPSFRRSPSPMPPIFVVIPPPRIFCLVPKNPRALLNTFHAYRYNPSYRPNHPYNPLQAIPIIPAPSRESRQMSRKVQSFMQKFAVDEVCESVQGDSNYDV